MRNLETKCIRVEQIESFSTIYSMPDTRHCFDCDARPLSCVFAQLFFVPCPHGINEAVVKLSICSNLMHLASKFLTKISNVMACKNLQQYKMKKIIFIGLSK